MKNNFFRNYFGESNLEDPKKEEEMAKKGIKREGGGEINDLFKRVQCMTLQQCPTIKRGKRLEFPSLCTRD